MWIKNNIKGKLNNLIGKYRLSKKDSLLRWFSDKSYQYNLTPVYIERLNADGKYNIKYNTVQDIANKLGNKDVKNIALTGPYGSGKSSIIRTLERDFPKANYLNISLATLEDDTFFEDDPNKGNSKSKDEINHLIEYSILQQIIYKEKAQKLRQSRLKRIQNITWVKSNIKAALFVLAIIAILVLFQPKFLMADSLCKIFACNEEWKVFWDLLCLVYLICFAILIFGYIIISTHNSKINKLNIKDGEIDIEENNSIFNKHLDEIIYFFEVTDYNVVVIEDLDRFDTTHIFLKLRELNQLLNASNSINRRIVFIYAIRDDMFTDNTNRTKFFDYIATVIPVINSSNACDMLKNALSAKGVSENEIDDTTCRELGLYIVMRTLTHLEDFANMVAVAVKQDFMPSVTNIAGEAMSVLDYMIPLENSPDMEMLMDIGHYDDDYPCGIGDRVLYSPQFQPGRKYFLGYKPCHKYEEWAASLPEKAPKLNGFDIAKA